MHVRSARWILPALLVAACLPACRAAEAAPATPGPTVTPVPVAAAADSATTRRYRVSWPAVSDANGPASSYLDSVTVAGALVHAYAGAATVDTVAIQAPPVGSTITAKACVRAVRRSLASTPGCISWPVATADVAPPPPAPTVDSSGLALTRFVPDSIDLAPGDSVLVAMIGFNLRGDTVHLVSTTWMIDGVAQLVSADSTVRWRPVTTTSAWLVLSPTAQPTDATPAGGRLVRFLLPPTPAPMAHTS